MKLWNMLVVGTIGTLAAVGCSSTTTTTTDGGTTGGTDTGVKPPVDTGTPTPGVDTGTPPPPVDGGGKLTCADCQKEKCGAETTACGADPECGKRITCMNDCIGKPEPAKCQNACISSIPSTAADNLISCLQSKCMSECFTAG